MKAALIIVLTQLLSFVIYAQINVNIGVDTSSAQAKQAIEFYSQYIDEFKTKGKVKYEKYYRKDDLKNMVYPDKVAFSLIGNTPTYNLGNPLIIALKNHDDLIHLKVLFAESDSLGVITTYFISNHYVSFEFDQPKFLIPLVEISKTWETRTIRNVHFHYPKGYVFNKEKADSLIQSIIQLEKDWVVSAIDINYYFSKHDKEIQELKGFDFNFYMAKTEYPSGISYAKENTTFSSGWGENYFHEIVHLYLNHLFPNSPLKEGLAVFYGGSLGLYLDAHLKRLNDYLVQNPSIDISSSKEFYYMDEQTNPQYTIQAFICYLVYEKKGVFGLRKLMEYDSIEEIYLSEFGVSQNEINSFIRRQLSAYCRNK